MSANSLEESMDSASNRRRGLIQSWNAINTLLAKLRDVQPSYEDEDVESPRFDLSQHASIPIDEVEEAVEGEENVNTRSPPVLTPLPSPPVDHPSVTSLQMLAERISPKQGMEKRSNVTDVSAFLINAYDFLSSIADKVKQDENVKEETQSTPKPKVTIDMCWHQLADCIDSLLVHGNVAPGLLRDLLLVPKPLHTLLNILERAYFLTGEGIEGRGDSFVPQRTTRELHAFREQLKREGVPPNLLEKICTVYAIEFLFDVSLPSAVCSGKYDGIHAIICEKKAALYSDLLHQRNRGFCSSMLGKMNVGLSNINHLCILGGTTPPSSVRNWKQSKRKMTKQKPMEKNCFLLGGGGGETGPRKTQQQQNPSNRPGIKCEHCPYQLKPGERFTGPNGQWGDDNTKKGRRGQEKHEANNECNEEGEKVLRGGEANKRRREEEKRDAKYERDERRREGEKKTERK